MEVDWIVLRHNILALPQDYIHLHRKAFLTHLADGHKISHLATLHPLPQLQSREVVGRHWLDAASQNHARCCLLHDA